MKKNKKIILLITLILIAAIGIHYSISYIRIAKIGAGYKAKVLCSGIFISGRTPGDIIENDLNIPILDYFDYEIDYIEKSVTVSILWDLLSRKASFLSDRGAVLDYESELHQFIQEYIPARNTEISGDANLETSELFASINYELINKIINDQFTEKDTLNKLRTQAVLILYKGKIVAEKYDKKINSSTRLCGWSMTKTFGNALTGVLIQKGFANVDDPVNLSYWKKDQKKNRITLDNILRMSPGLEFDESYKKYDSDVMRMLYLVDNAAKYAAEKNLIHHPGTVWNYSSGTSILLAKFIQERLQEKNIKPLKFAYEELMFKIGMYSSILETDAAGTMVISTGLFATAREWARLGKLYLQNGNWNGEQLFPEWWLNYSAKPTETSRYKKHGAHLWIKPDSAKKPEQLNVIKQLPDDIMNAAGHYGQFLFIIPSKDLVVIRLAQTYDSDDFNEYKFILDICNAINDNTKIK